MAFRVMFGMSAMLPVASPMRSASAAILVAMPVSPIVIALIAIIIGIRRIVKTVNIIRGGGIGRAVIGIIIRIGRDDAAA